MAESTITSKGQTTIPADVRARIGATPGTRLVWHVTPAGSLVVRIKNRSVLDLAGKLAPPKGRRLEIEDLGF